MQKSDILGIAACLGMGVFPTPSGATPESAICLPNVIVILTDDQGYGDVGVFGGNTVTTPHLDRMAREGVMMTNFYASSPVCSASRSSLLTGCYPQRISIPSVVSPGTGIGLSPDEVTIAEMLQQEGYVTGLIGKWHLGYEEPFLPTRHGFDMFFGSTYSIGSGMRDGAGGPDSWPRAGWPLFEGETIIEMDSDKGELTQRYTRRAVQFIEENKDRKFFLYLAHHMPHTPLHVSEAFKGKGGNGVYSDVIAEIDWSTGEILDALKQFGIDERTLVIFLSDNGPWLIFGDHGGSPGVLRDGKKQTSEGGMRVPCIMRWPGTIPREIVCDQVATAMDILPTLSRLCGGKLPSHTIDGEDISNLLFEPQTMRPHLPIFYYWESELRGVREGDWKLQFPHRDQNAPDPTKIGMGGTRGKVMTIERSQALYNLAKDPAESADLSASHPEVLEHLSQLAEAAREELGDSIHGVVGSGVRPCGRTNR